MKRASEMLGKSGEIFGHVPAGNAGSESSIALEPRADEQWPFYAPDEIEAVAAVLRSGRVNQWTGPDVFAFEQAWTERFGSGRAGDYPAARGYDGGHCRPATDVQDRSRLPVGCVGPVRSHRSDPALPPPRQLDRRLTKAG